MAWQFFVVCMAAAAADILWRRVPNIWLAAWFLTGLLLSGLFPLQIPIVRETGEVRVFSGAAGSAAAYLARGAAASLLFYPAWRLGMAGAGDVKLFGLAAAWLGIPAFGACFLYSLFLGALWSLWKLWRGKLFRQRFLRFFRYLQEADRKLKGLRTGGPSPGPILPPYYDSRRDGRGITIPFALCVFGGALLRMLQQGGAIL